MNAAAYPTVPPPVARWRRAIYHEGVGLVRTWTGQVARAAGATLIAPLVLLLAAGVVASGGALGSVGSLGEIASGPSLPDIGLASTPGSALEGAEIVGADVPQPADVSEPPSASPQQLASATPSPPGRAAVGERGRVARSPHAETQRGSVPAPGPHAYNARPTAGRRTNAPGAGRTAAGG